MPHPVIGQLEADPHNLKSNWCLPQAEARLIYLLAHLAKAKHILEIGTSIGYSTLHLALAVSKQQGKVVTIDASAERQAVAKQHLAQAGLETSVDFYCADALTALKQLIAEKQAFDLIFVDARKSEYLDYFLAGEQLLKADGLWVADNTRSHRHKMQNLIDVIATCEPQWIISDLETPSGLIIAQKQA